MVKLNTIVELSDIPGFSSLNADGQRAVKLAVEAAKGARLNANDQIKVDTVRVRDGADVGEVLTTLHNIEDITIKTKPDNETGRAVITAIPDITLRASLSGRPVKADEPNIDPSEFSDFYQTHFGKSTGQK